MISRIKNFFNNKYYRIKFIQFNKFFFYNTGFLKKNSIFLVEFNAFHDHHAVNSQFS
jgi:hypothetical protein